MTLHVCSTHSPVLDKPTLCGLFHKDKIDPNYFSKFIQSWISIESYLHGYDIQNYTKCEKCFDEEILKQAIISWELTH